MKNKTDKDLLRLSAKAAGLGVIDLLRDDSWNPLEYNNQAFELMVELKFRVDHVHARKQQVMAGDGDYWAIVPYDGNPFAATRRAIVIAAAKLAEGRYGH